MNKFGKYVPNFLKLPLYSWLLKGIINPKTHDKLFQYWKHPSDGNLPQDYMKRRYRRSQFLIKLIKRYAEPNAKILEIGCNVGRNLNHLFNAGYTKLAGVEISEDAIDLMKRVYPKMAKQTKIYNKPVEDIIKNFEDDIFEVVFTMAVLQCIHTDSKFIFPQMVRITNKYLITIEDERSVSWKHFPRNYKKIFESLSMRQIYQTNLKNIGKSHLQVRVFQKVKK